VSTRDDLASLDLALPDVVAGTHFGVPSYKANSRNFIGVDRDGGCATFALADEDVAELRSAGVAFDELRRAGNLVGVRIELGQVTPETLAGIVRASWTHVTRRRR
jgi:hypothetical protein